MCLRVCVYVCGLYVIECKVKGTLGSDWGETGESGDELRGLGCYRAQGHIHTDGHHIEISKWTA